MNSYELSRNFCEWAFNNPEKVKPIHYAIYFFSIEHCNRLGWKDKFGLPSQMVMEAIGVKNWRTYSAGLSDLVEFGFIEMIEISKNQYSSNIVAIVKNTKAPTKTLDKALSKHSTKHTQSTVSIDKQETKNKEQVTEDKDIERAIALESDFENFWNAYSKKVDYKKSKKKFMALSDINRHHILNTVSFYVKRTPEIKFRKNPYTWLNGECWKDELSIMKEADLKEPKSFTKLTENMNSIPKDPYELFTK